MSDKSNYITVSVNQIKVEIIIEKKNIQLIYYISIYHILYRLILHFIFFKVIFNLLKCRISQFN